MCCRAVQEQLRVFSAGELPADGRQAVQIHLAKCARCRAAMVRVDALAAALINVQAPAMPAGFASRIVAVARQRQGAGKLVAQRAPRRWRLMLAPLRAAAAVAAFAVGVWGAAEASRAAPAEAVSGDSRPDAETVLRDWFEAAPAYSLASRYLDAIGRTSAGED